MAAITTTYYTLNDCCTGQPYTINDQILCFIYTGLCEIETCPEDIEGLVITSISSEATPDYITGCFNLTQVQSVPPGAFTTNYVNAIASVNTVPTCADCQECCYKLTNCQTDEVIYSNTNTLGQYFNKIVTLNGQEGCWDVGISFGDCECLISTVSNNETSVQFTGNVIGTYSGYNVYESQVGEETYYAWGITGSGWIITQGGYGEGEEWPIIAEAKFEGACPASLTEDFTWTYYLEGYTLVTEKCPAECICPIPVTVLKSFDDCPSCLPIVAYKFTNCNNQTLVQYSTEDYSAYVGKTVELECGNCWFVSQIDYTPPSTQTINILYTFDSCLACNRTYYKLTNCTNSEEIIYTYSDLSNLPISVIDCTECIRVSFTYSTGELSTNYQFDIPATGTDDGKTKYGITGITVGPYTNANIDIDWNSLPTPQWNFDFLGSNISTLSNDTVCPLGNFPDSTTPEAPFINIEITPCGTLPVITIKECDGCFTVEETREPVNPTTVTQLEVYGDCEECLPPPPPPPVPEPAPRRKVKPGYSTPSCDIEKYEKITCKSSEIYYKQVMRLRYGISNCCPEDEEKWLIKKELIDLDALRDPDYICQPVTSCCGQTINTCGCGCGQAPKTCNS